MCGIAGIINRNQTVEPLERMLALIRHRGPDECGIYQDGRLAMGSVRLNIIDLATGRQPISNEDNSIWIVFNGEIYNYLELMVELEAKGHTFRTASDTEVIVHLYEELGAECVQQLNGQFAFALWDTRTETLFLARDRVGIRPLFYTRTADALIFASEIKAILAHPGVTPQLDPLALDQIFTFWAPLTPQTAFREIYELPPGHLMVVSGERQEIRPYWQLQFPPHGRAASRKVEDAVEEFRTLLQDAVRLRLRADVPVGAYLSGGIDSCATAAFIKRTQSNLRTFSIGFSDPEFDESAYQRQAVEYLGTQHTSILCSQADIGRTFPEVIWHTETPILRTAPAPLFLLSRLVRDSGYKVVVTGEGADEMLAGYNIFKEALIRQFWARQPDSEFRPLLLHKLYPYLPLMQRAGRNVLRTFFGYHLGNTADPIYSHTLRWRNTGRIKQFFSPAMREQIGNYNAVDDLRGRLGPRLQNWPLLSRAQYLETNIFMSGYLLSSQGDRMAMAHSVEGRYPFLDHRLIEFCAHLPPRFKLRGLTEKLLLKRAVQDKLPNAIVQRSKQPYRAPIASSFCGPETLDATQELLSAAAVEAAGVFSSPAAARLLRKAQSGRPLSETEGMALVGILSTQLVHRLFCQEFHQQPRQTIEPVHRVIRQYS